MWAVPMLLLTTCTKSGDNAWFCDPDGYYVYKAHVQVEVTPHQMAYQVGDTVWVTYFWPDTFVDSLSGVSFTFSNQEAANPLLLTYFMDANHLYPGNGVDTTFDLIAGSGSFLETFFLDYPEYDLQFGMVDSGLYMNYGIVFHTPGRYMHTVQMNSLGEDRAVFLNNCTGETVDFYFDIVGNDYYSSITSTPRPAELQNFYDSYAEYSRRAGFIFNVQP